MDKTTKFKEAFKVALAFALVYGIALKVNWLSPSWAGWAVVAIAALSGGQSLQKGLLRIWGTILACAAGIVIISLGAQNRWLFMFLTAFWLFLCTYKMLADKKRSYFWFVAAYVCLVITAAGPSPTGGFYIAVYRTMDTILGIVVYTLIAVFIWPLSNAGAIKNSLKALLGTQSELLQGAHALLSGSLFTDKLQDLRRQQVNQMVQFSQSLSAEGAENYQVQEIKPLWNILENFSNALLRSSERLFAGIEDLSNFDWQKDRPEMDRFFEEISNRFIEMTNLLSGNPPGKEIQDVKLTIASVERKDISHLDKAALAIIVRELNEMEAISRKMLDVVLEIRGFSVAAGKIISDGAHNPNISGNKISVIDIEYFKASLFVASAVIFGFVIWFYVNPPGHSLWYIMGGVFALILAGAPQVKAVKLISPFLVTMFLAALIYLLILPRLSGFLGLGLLLFVCMFIIQYRFSGPATAIFNIAFLQLVVITNPQVYDLSGLINSFVFVSMFMIYLFGMSYIISSPRPEKAFLKLVSRFFRSSKYLISPRTVFPENSSSFLQSFKTDFHLYELHSLPDKIKAWGKAIDKNLFSNTDPQQIEEMVISLEMLIVRIEALMIANNGYQESKLNTELSSIISDWGKRLEEALEGWGHIPEEVMQNNSSELVLERISLLEQKLNDIATKSENEIGDEEGIQFYHLLGGYRGVTEAALSFVKVAGQMNWEQWKEEKFQ